MMEKGGINKLCIVSRHVKSKCQNDQLLVLQIRNNSSPFSDSIVPFRFGGQTMRTKEICKCYHRSLDQSTTVRKTDTCMLLLQDNCRQTVFVTSYKQLQHWSPFIDRYFLIQSSTDTFLYTNMHQPVTSSICGK
jgi:hypothetical protein